MTASSSTETNGYQAYKEKVQVESLKQSWSNLDRIRAIL